MQHMAVSPRRPSHSRPCAGRKAAPNGAGIKVAHFSKVVGMARAPRLHQRHHLHSTLGAAGGRDGSMGKDSRARRTWHHGGRHSKAEQSSGKASYTTARQGKALHGKARFGTALHRCVSRPRQSAWTQQHQRAATLQQQQSRLDAIGLRADTGAAVNHNDSIVVNAKYTGGGALCKSESADGNPTVLGKYATVWIASLT